MNGGLKVFLVGRYWYCLVSATAICFAVFSLKRRRTKTFYRLLVNNGPLQFPSAQFPAIKHYFVYLLSIYALRLQGIWPVLLPWLVFYQNCLSPEGISLSQLWPLFTFRLWKVTPAQYRPINTKAVISTNSHAGATVYCPSIKLDPPLGSHGAEYSQYTTANKQYALLPHSYNGFFVDIFQKKRYLQIPEFIAC